MSGKYDDIMYMDRPDPRTRARMPLADRAAQFAPFAALTGFDDCLAEVRRETQERPELSDDEAQILNEQILALEPGDAITVIFFAPDPRREGGSYVRHAGMVHRVDAANRTIEFCDGARVSVDDLIEIRSPDKLERENK